ncbi:MAG: ACT domain-containing protein [Actinobacteria bacterium]|nr:ACT domain-containing protein [Actinomycetota bacterium]
MEDPGVRDLDELLRGLRPERRPGEYVVVSTTSESTLPALATVVEDEGTTLVLERHHADAFRLEHTATFAWITLTVHSSLEAVGLTAAVSRALAAQGIPCNVLAGFHHDHLLVPFDRAEDALAVLEGLSSAGRA